MTGLWLVRAECRALAAEVVRGEPEVKHSMLCVTEACQQVARIWIGKAGYCPACYDRRQREKGK